MFYICGQLNLFHHASFFQEVYSGWSLLHKGFRNIAAFNRVAVAAVRFRNYQGILYFYRYDMWLDFVSGVILSGHSQASYITSTRIQTTVFFFSSVAFRSNFLGNWCCFNNVVRIYLWTTKKIMDQINSID